MKRRIEVIPEETLDAMRLYPWPRNVRELANLVERSVILSPGPCLAVPPGVSRAPAERQSFAGSSGAPGCGLLIDSRRFDDNAVERLDSAYSLARRASRSGQAGHGAPAARVVPTPPTNWAAK